MKWSIVALFVLGLLAAVASVVLMISLRGPRPVEARMAVEPGQVEEARKVQVLVAASDLGLREVVDSDDLVGQAVEEDAAPRNSFSDPVQVVGKVLVVPMKKGQPFLEECFASQGSGLLLASALAPGSRAVSLVLSDHMGIEELLFPGCMVDVIVTVETEEVDSPELGKSKLSFTLLENVMVLAVGTSSIVEGDQESGDAVGSNRPPITLLLDPDQAELAKLAMEYGSVSLAMRNPMDESGSSGGAKSVDRLSPALADVVQRAQEMMRRKRLEEREKREYEMEKERLEIQKARDDAALAKLKYEQEMRALEEAEEAGAWEVTVMRGSASQTQSFSPPRPRNER